MARFISFQSNWQNLLKDEGGKGHTGFHFPKRRCHPWLRTLVKCLAGINHWFQIPAVECPCNLPLSEFANF